MSMFEYISHAARTDVGKKRSNNEDAFGGLPEAGVYCVADGMGGGDDGEIASAKVVEEVEAAARKCIPPGDAAYAAEEVAEVVEKAVSSASSWIFERARKNGLNGCGSTFVGFVLDAHRPGNAIALHVGDSRLYRIRGRSIKQITRDHSAAELMGARNDKGVNPVFQSMILKAVGTQPEADVERTPFDVAEGDRLLLCSDGLSRMVPDGKLLSISRKHRNLDEAADALIAAALDSGGVDNVTLIIVEAGRLPPPAECVPLPAAEAAFGGDGNTGDATCAPQSDDESCSFQTLETSRPALGDWRPPAGRFAFKKEEPPSAGGFNALFDGVRWKVVASAGAVLAGLLVVCMATVPSGRETMLRDGDSSKAVPRQVFSAIAPRHDTAPSAEMASAPYSDGVAGSAGKSGNDSIHAAAPQQDGGGVPSGDETSGPVPAEETPSVPQTGEPYPAAEAGVDGVPDNETLELVNGSGKEGIEALLVEGLPEKMGVPSHEFKKYGRVSAALEIFRDEWGKMHGINRKLEYYRKNKKTAIETEKELLEKLDLLLAAFKELGKVVAELRKNATGGGIETMRKPLMSLWNEMDWDADCGNNADETKTMLRIIKELREPWRQ